MCLRVSVQDGWTAAMFASGEGKDGCLQLLIAAGAKLDERDNVRECKCVCLSVCLFVSLRIAWVKCLCD